MVEECRRLSALMGSRAGSGHNNMEFDQVDDEQLMSMFADEIAVGPAMSLSNASSPSDHNSNNDDKQVAPLDQHGQLQGLSPKRIPLVSSALGFFKTDQLNMFNNKLCINHGSII